MKKSTTLLKVFLIAITLFEFGLSNENIDLMRQRLKILEANYNSALSDLEVHLKNNPVTSSSPNMKIKTIRLKRDAKLKYDLYMAQQSELERLIKTEEPANHYNTNLPVIPSPMKSKETKSSWDGLNIIANNLHVSAELEKKQRELLKLEEKYKNIQKTLSDLQNKYQNLENEKNNDNLKFEAQYQEISKNLSDLQNKYQNLENEKNELVLNIQEKEVALSDKEKKINEEQIKANQEINALKSSLELEKKKLENQICAEPIIEKNEPDACRCLMEDGDSDFIKKNKDACDKIIEREFEAIRNKLISIDIKN